MEDENDALETQNTKISDDLDLSIDSKTIEKEVKSQKQKEKQHLSLNEQIKRSKTKNIVLAILSRGEIIGLDEIIDDIDGKKPKRKSTMQVCTPECEYLFLSARDFHDNFYDNNAAMK